MRRIIVLMMCLVLLLSAVCVRAEGAALTLDQLANMTWSFSSGVGGWSTDIRTAAGGSFSGEYHDSEMGETGDGFPNGSIYHCNFTGKLSLQEQVDAFTWKVRIDSLTLDEAPGNVSIEDDGIRYVSCEVYGLSEGDEMLLYLPGAPVDGFTEDMQMWAHLFEEEVKPSVLEDWFLYSENNESGFVGYSADDDVSMGNPWVEMTEEELLEASGVAFNVPEGAENIVYCWLKSENLAEMQFTIDGDAYCARIQPADLKEGELMNISGMYFDWENVEEVTIGHCYGTIGQAKTGSEDWVELCQWYDLAPGLMYSLSVSTTELDGLDLTAIAEMVYDPMQSDS